jgi:hypothetical protein
MAEIPTPERLARALEALNDPNLAGMIEKARAGYYDDFKSPLALPEIQLVQDLIALGRRDFAQRVVDGEFDATLEESNAWWEAEGKYIIDDMVNQWVKGKGREDHPEKRS